MARGFREGRETGASRLIGADKTGVVWVEPIKTVDPRQYNNTVTAMVIVSIDFSRNMISSGGLGVAYGTGLAVAGLIALIMYFIIIRLSQKPYEVLNDDLDQVLRGEIPKVTHEFKIPETQGLWDNVNSAVQRMSKSDGMDHSTDGMVNWDQECAMFLAIAEAGSFGFVAFDPQLNLLSVNSMFEDISAIRAESIGQKIAAIADQAVTALVNDLLENARRNPSHMATDKAEFQNISYSVTAVTIGPKEQSGLAILFKRKDG
jgi:hypothetical protein